MTQTEIVALSTRIKQLTNEEVKEVLIAAGVYDKDLKLAPLPYKGSK